MEHSALPVVVAAGGDGTLSLVADTVPDCVPIVPMPLGTENLLARNFGHTADAEDVVKTVYHGMSHRIDAGRANGKLFLVMATCGFDAEVVRAMHLRRSGHIRRIHYASPIFRALRRYQFPKIHVEVADCSNETGDPRPREMECCWAMVFNFPCYAGHLKIEPDANGSDGLLDVITFRKGSIGSGLRYLAGVVTGRHKKFGDVISTRGTSIRFSCESRVPYQLDGDYGGHLPLRIEMLPSRVRLLLPASPEDGSLPLPDRA